MIRTNYNPEQILAKREAIKAAVLGNASEQLSRPSNLLLTALISEYDKKFFKGFFKTNNISFSSHWSDKMTSAGGRIRFKGVLRDFLTTEERIGYIQKSGFSFTMTLSSYHILRNFSSPDSTEVVNGLTAHSRYEALCFIVEHELIHAFEVVLTGKSGHGAFFQRLAHSFFGHTAYHHEIGKLKAEDTDSEELREKFAACSARVGVPADVFGACFYCKGSAIKIVSINTKRPKYPFTGIDQNGKIWKLTKYQALSATKQNKREDSK